MYPELLLLLLLVRVELLLLLAVELLLLLTELLLLLIPESGSHHHPRVDGDGELLLEVLEVVGELHSSGRSWRRAKGERAKKTRQKPNEGEREEEAKTHED